MIFLTALSLSVEQGFKLQKHAKTPAKTPDPVSSLSDIIQQDSFKASNERDKTMPSLSDKRPKSDGLENNTYVIEKAPGGTYQIKQDNKEQEIFCSPKIENTGTMIRIEQAIDPKINISGLDKMIAEKKIRSYTRENNNIIIFADSSDALEQLKALKPEAEKNNGTGFLSKAKELFIPPNIEENCAPEYLQFRGWSLASTVFSSAISFMMTRLNLDAIKIAFSSTENVALAGVVNSVVSRVTRFASSFLAKKGDEDPKKTYLTSNLISVGSTLGFIGSIAIAPMMLVPVNAILSVTTALAESLGSSTSVNITNHMVKGPAKGVVTAKDSNQDTVANLLGMPVAMGLSRAAEALSVNPYLFALVTAGSLYAICSTKAISSLQCESLTKSNLEKVVNGFINNGNIPKSEKTGMLTALKNLIKGENDGYSKNVHFVGSLDEVIGKNFQSQDKEKSSTPEAKQNSCADDLYATFNKENYILNLLPDKSINIGFNKKSDFEEITKSYIHAMLIESAIKGGLHSNLEKICGPKADTALVDLSYRALPKDMKYTSELSNKGWFPSASKLGIVRIDAEWSGPEKRPCKELDIAQFKELVSSNDVEKLKHYIREEYIP